jgi:hypothetical protein
MRELRDALSDDESFNERLAGRHPAVFLDDNGTLTAIVDRPQDAAICERRRVRDQAGAIDGPCRAEGGFGGTARSPRLGFGATEDQGARRSIERRGSRCVQATGCEVTRPIS